MLKKTGSALLIGALILAGCVAVETREIEVSRANISQSLINKTHATIREMMKDPESTKFRRTVTYRSVEGDHIICGEHDAKNGFGGYTGYEKYYFRYRNGLNVIKHVDSSSRDYQQLAETACSQAAQGAISVVADG